MIMFKGPDVMIRRRVPLQEDTIALNARLVTEMADIKGFWSPAKQASDAIFDPPVIDEDNDGLADLDFCECLVDGLMGAISYNSRPLPHWERDRAQHDDFMSIAVNPKKADRSVFFEQSLPKVLTIFGAYRAQFETDKRSTLESDFNKIRELSNYGQGPDVDGRDGVYRLWPVNYFDETLCQRAFGMSATEAVRRAALHCDDARIVNDGAYLIVTTEIVTGAEALNALHNRLAGPLGITLL